MQVLPCWQVLRRHREHAVHRLHQGPLPDCAGVWPAPLPPLPCGQVPGGRWQQRMRYLRIGPVHFGTRKHQPLPAVRARALDLRKGWAIAVHSNPRRVPRISMGVLRPMQQVMWWWGAHAIAPELPQPDYMGRPPRELQCYRGTCGQRRGLVRCKRRITGACIRGTSDRRRYGPLRSARFDPHWRRRGALGAACDHAPRPEPACARRPR